MKSNKNILIGAAIILLTGGIAFFVISSEPRSGRSVNHAIADPTEQKQVESQHESSNAATSLVSFQPKSEVNFFLENSASMDGYATGNSDFKQALGQIYYNLDLDNSIKFGYFNTKYYSSKREFPEFVSQLANIPTDVPSWDRSTSDINLMFKAAVEATKNGSVSILVSDGIYSLPQIRTAEEGLSELNSAKLKTRNTLISVIEGQDLMTVVIKLSSKFKGTFFRADHSSVKLDQHRPYYLWIFGSPKQVEKALQAINVESLPGYKERATFFRTNDLKPKYTILTSGNQKIGDFRRSHDYAGSETHEVEDAEKTSRGANTGYFGFGLAIDFSDVYLSPAHLLNQDNYSVKPSNYQITSAESVSDEDLKMLVYNKLSFKPNYVLGLKTNGAFLGDVTVTLSNATPAWIAQSGSTNDNNIVGETSKTFGFKLLMEGIEEAYSRLNKKEELLSLTVKIKP